MEGNGQLDRETTALVIRDEGKNLESLMVILLFELFDKDKNGYISFYDEFIPFISDMQNLNKIEILRLIFDLVDENKSNDLDMNEVYNMGRMMGFNVSRYDAIETLKALDKNGDNRISFEEFCQYLD